jgi:ribonuclease P protein subunit RPR2
MAIAGTAQAGNDQSPGALKKQETAPVVAAPAPAPQANPKSAAPQGSGQAKAAPVTKGTVKKLVQTSAQPSAPGQAKKAARSQRVVARRTTARRAAHRRAVRRRQSATRRASQHGVPVRARGKANAPGQQIAAGAPGTAPGQARRRPAATAANPAAKAKPKHTGTAPLTTISQAADHVVEVIPGAVILGMAGLATMVLMLIMRSLAVERQRGKALATSYGVTVEALATAIEAKDLTTGGHIERVRRLGLLLAASVVPPRDARDPQMAYGFLLHDIGKLAVPDAILRAPGRLTEEQWALMRRHPEEGVRMLSNVPFLDRALDVVRHHHERWDGGGYPDGLRGEEIPLWARIFSVVDALDAMTAERPYRAARSYEDALAEIRRNSGTQFDPAIVAALERIDPAAIAPLLEPQQLVEPPAELPTPKPLVAA